MNTSGEAAEQIVRYSLQGVETTLKITGSAAKEIAIALIAISKQKKKTKGRASMEKLLREGKPLTIFSIPANEASTFQREAKHYGILYCMIKNRKDSPDNLVDIMVKQEDAYRVNRIVERFQIASVAECKQIKEDIERQAEKQPNQNGEVLDELLSKEEKTDGSKRPFIVRTEKEKTPPALSERKSKKSKNQDKEGTSDRKKSVRKELQEIRKEQVQKREAKLAEKSMRMEYFSPAKRQKRKDRGR